MKTMLALAFLGIAGLVEGSETIHEATGAVHVKGKQICSLNGSFSGSNYQRATLGVHCDQMPNVNSCPVLTLPQPGMHVNHHSEPSPQEPQFESFKGYAFDPSHASDNTHWHVTYLH